MVISSISGEIGIPLRSAYCSSKFAVTGGPASVKTEYGPSLNPSLLRHSAFKQKRGRHVTALSQDVTFAHLYAAGFFEALRMECGEQIDVTICCPPSVRTGMRDEKVRRCLRVEQYYTDAVVQ